MSGNTTIHSGITATEVLPAPLHGTTTTSSTLLSTKRLKLSPQTPDQAQGPGATLNWKLSDSGFLDLPTWGIHANVKYSGTAGGCLDDLTSWIYQMQTKTDGQNIENLQHVNRLTCAETYMTCSPALYNRTLSFCGAWKYNPDNKAFIAATGVQGVVANQWNDVSGNSAAAIANYAATNVGGGGWDVFIPLGLMSHVWRSRKYFPNRYANNMELSFKLATIQDAIFGGATALTNPSFTVNNLYLEGNVIYFNEAYTAALEEDVRGGEGLYYPLNVKEDQVGQVYTNGGQVSFSVSRGTKNLRRVAIVQQPTLQASGGSGTSYPYPVCSTFAAAGFANGGYVQLKIAGTNYPQDLQYGSAAFFQSHMAYNGLPITDGDGGLVNYRAFNTTTTGTTGTTGSPLFSDMWIWAYDLSKMIGTSAQLDDDGIDTTGNSQITVKINSGALENGASAVSFTPLVETLGTVWMVLKDGKLKIV